MLDNFKSHLHQGLDELFASAAVDNLTNDMDEYQSKLEDIVIIASVLGIDTEIISVTLNLKSGEGFTEWLNKKTGPHDR